MAKSKTTLIISNREGSVKRTDIKKAVAKVYAKLGIDSLWDGKVSKKVIKIQ